MGTKLLVSNLPLDFDSGDLEDLFTMIGDVRAVAVSLGVGHIELATEMQAVDCIAHFHGQVKNGNRLVVREDKPHVSIKPKPRLKAERRAR